MKRLGEILWEMGRAEAAALSVMTLVQADPVLSDAERRFVEEQMLREERDHARVTRAWAAKWARPRRGPYNAFGALIAFETMMGAQLKPATRFAPIFAATHWNEVVSLKAYDHHLPLFERVSADLARDFRAIRADEARHVEWGRGVLRRLERENVPAFRRVSHAYRLVRHLYSSVLNHAHTEPLAQLARELGL